MTLTKKLFLVILLIIATTSAMQIHAKERAVALVFDDSTSMNGKPFYAVNYALQTMIGLLNPNDKLYVVRMTSPDKAQLINLSDKQTEIIQVRKWKMCKQTLFEAVQTAMDILQKSTSDDKWLIVFTDGEMNIIPQHITKTREFMTTSGAKTILLNINIKENNLAQVFRQTGQVDIMQSPADFGKITAHMEKIALSVMGMTQSGLSVNTGQNYITIDSLLPLKRLIVLEQDAVKKESDLRKIEKATDANGSDIQMAGSYYAAIPGTLFGKITHMHYADNPDAVIPKGRITIQFDKEIKNSRFKFLPEVAASLSARPAGGFHHSEGNVYFVCENANSIMIKAEMKTADGNYLPNEILGQTEVTVFYNNQSAAMTLSGNVFTYTLPINSDDVPVSVSATFPGYFNFRSNVFTIRKFDCPKLGIKPPPVYTRKVTELDDAPYITLIPMINKVKATPEQYKFLSLNCPNPPDLQMEIIRDKEAWKVRPKTTWGMPCFTPTGRFRVQFDLQSTQKNVTPSSITVDFDIQDVSFLEKWGIFIIGLIVLILVIWYILGLIKKDRFAGGAEIVYQRSTEHYANKARTYPLKGSFFNRYLLPYKPETSHVFGMKFQAGRRDSYVIIPADSQSDNMRISGNKVDDPGRRILRFSKGEELVVEGRSQKEIYTYSVV